ncbi:MAG: hemolysin family protein [Verrucomicrobia bacterium]|nr:hemolysin family protein [Verrucomicrobiota bacterium]
MDFETLLVGPRLVLSLGLLIGAGFFSALLAAFTRTGEAGLSRLTEKSPSVAFRLAKWDSRWDLLLNTLLILSVALQVFAVATAVTALHPDAAAYTLVLGVLLFVYVAVIVFLWEILPDALSESYADRITLVFFALARALTILLFPLSWPLSRIERRLLSSVMAVSDEADRPSAEDEIRSLVDQSGEEDLEEEEREIIRSVFEFGETIAREIMTPRIDVLGLEDSLTVEQAVNKVKDSSHSRFPVFHDTLDDIRGILHIKQLLRSQSQGDATQPVLKASNPVTYVPESMPINDLMQLLRSEQEQLAIVVDEYGGTAGIVSMEDVIEELVGEIHDEYDIDETKVQRLSEGSVILSARLPVDEVNELLGISIPEAEEYDSVGGYIFQTLGRIPKPGEVLSFDGYTLTIERARAHQIVTVRMDKTSRSEEN